jgi:predicted nucleotidyltransferase
MSSVLLDEQIVAIERAFTEARIPHAFGGAQALAYYGSVRATQDIDVNVFLPADEAERVFAVLSGLGAAASNPGLRRLALRDEQVRVLWEDTPIDLFFAYDPLHQSSLERRRRVDFYGDPIHILSAEDLITYKATFDREKDWRDIAGIIFASEQPLDFDYVREWLRKIDGPEGSRLARLERLIESGGQDLGA